MTNWNTDLVAQIAGAIKRQRESSTPKITAAELSRRTVELGLPISRAVISDLETGRKRTLDVSELIVLARALGVPPVELIYPDLPDGQVEAWPGHRTRSILAAQWFSGEYQPDVTDGQRPSPIKAARAFESAVDNLIEALAEGDEAIVDRRVTLAVLLADWLIRQDMPVDVERLPEQLRDRLTQLPDSDDA